jgi:hypothetical protein
VHGENAYLHYLQDLPSEAPNGATPVQGIPTQFMEMVLGHRSGGTQKASPLLGPGSLIWGAASAVYGAATLTDATQAWGTVNQVNKLVGVADTVTKTTQWDIVLSHTATVLTMKSNWLAQPANASQYFIQRSADQNQGATVSYAAGPANALVDTAKAWVVNQWAGYFVAVSAQLRLVVSNTATQLTLDAAWSTTPAAQQAYGIVAQFADSWVNTQRGVGSSARIAVGQGADVNPNNI